MADYNINKSDGTAVTIATGAIDNQFDIPFLGQDSINYGDDLATAMLRQLENFANTTAPAFGASRTIGQQWYDTTAGQGMKIWDGGTWDLIPLSTDVVHLTGAETINGVKTFNASAGFTNAAVPFTVNSTTVVPNLNADMLDDRHWTAFATSADGLLAQNAEPDLLTPPVDGYLLSSTIAGSRSWVSPSAGTGNVDPVDAAGDFGPLPVLLYPNALAGTPEVPFIDEGGLTYDAGSNILSTSVFSGSLNGNAATATIATSATTATIATTITLAATASATTFVVVADTATGNQGGLTDAVGLPYNAATDTLGATAVTNYAGVGTALSALNAANITTGVLGTTYGGTGVMNATGTGSFFALQDSPTFTTEIFTPRVSSSGAIIIEWNNVPEIQTQDNTVSGNTSGAQVKTHGGVFEDIGYNTLPQLDWNANVTLEAQHCGHLTGSDDGSVYTITLPAAASLDFPVEGVTTITNGSAVDYDIADNGTATLMYLEPGVGLSDTVGGATVGPGGVATLYRFDAATFYIWGSEITY